jgi:glycosyltransferase involved in cell wall biosynthesis
LRILVFSELFYPHGGGAELATWLYSKLLVEEGFKVVIVTRQFPGEPSVEAFGEGLTVYRLSLDFMFASRYFTLANAGALATSFVSNLVKQSDIIYVPCGWYSIIPIAKSHNKPVIVHLHNYSIVCPTSLMYDFVEQKVGSSSRRSYVLHEIVERKRGSLSVVASLMMNECIGKFYNKIGMLSDVLIFVSKAQRDLVLSEAPSLREKSYVIHNPIPDTPLITAESGGIGYFGGKDFVKGLHILVQALKSLGPSNGVKAYLAMTSKGYVTVKLSNGATVNLLPRVNLAGIMRQLSIVVVPSLCPEPSPYTLIESMLYAKLIIASNIGGIPEILDGTTSGAILTQPGDYSQIANGLDFFLSLTLEEANELGIANREHILQKFENKQTIASFINVLDKVGAH